MFKILKKPQRNSGIGGMTQSVFGASLYRVLAAIVLTFGSFSVNAAVIGLFDWAVNIDGTVAEISLGDPIPAEVDDSLFNDMTGLGTLKATISGAGAHSFDLFVDHEIDENDNTWFNEKGFVTGTAAAGQSWEIDEPGLVDGDIYKNFQGSSLDNGIGTSIYGDTAFPDDVSMAMGWDFSLASGETAVMTFILSEIMPASGFFLTHNDPDSDANVYFSSALLISGGEPIPEPATLWLLVSGLLGYLGVTGSRRRA